MALILICREFDDAEEVRSYSSIRFARSSSDVIETRASRSSVGNWHLKLTEDPHISLSFTNSSDKSKSNFIQTPENTPKYLRVYEESKAKTDKATQSTNLRKKSNDPRREVGYDHRRTGACRLCCEEEFCLRNCRGILWCSLTREKLPSLIGGLSRNQD